MDCCSLSSTGLKDIDVNDIIADNITILHTLNVSGSTSLYNSLNVQGINILNSINNLNNIINNNSSLNINASNIINFEVNSTQLTKIDTTGSSIYHPTLETFPYNYGGWYNIGDRFLINYFMLCPYYFEIRNHIVSHKLVLFI
jgi:hypothetical protein